MKLVQRLPRKPELIAPKLRQSLRGCIWMRDEWRDLAGHVRGTTAGESPRPLDALGRRRAGDLLGLSAERRLGLTPLDPPGGSASEAEVAAHQGALIATLIAALETLTSAEMVALDESIRVDTMNGIHLTIDDQIRLIRRYETEARRVKERAFVKFQELKDIAAAVKKQAEERELQKRMHLRPIPRPVSQNTIDTPWARKAPSPVVERETQTQPEAQPEAPGGQVEAAQVSPPRKWSAKKPWPRKKFSRSPRNWPPRPFCRARAPGR